MTHNIDFSKNEWIEAADGIRYKAFKYGSQQIRLVEFYEGFKEPDWCKVGHSGYILDGECKINFNGHVESLKKGDILHIPSGDEHKHMVLMEKGGWVQVLLFEQI